MLQVQQQQQQQQQQQEMVPFRSICCLSMRMARLFLVSKIRCSVSSRRTLLSARKNQQEQWHQGAPTQTRQGAPNYQLRRAGGPPTTQ